MSAPEEELTAAVALLVLVTFSCHWIWIVQLSGTAAVLQVTVASAAGTDLRQRRAPLLHVVGGDLGGGAGGEGRAVLGGVDVGAVRDRDRIDAGTRGLDGDREACRGGAGHPVVPVGAIEAARLAASMATSERTPELSVVDSASACIFAMPSMPTAMMISATMTSMRLKPRDRVGLCMCWLMKCVQLQVASVEGCCTEMLPMLVISRQRVRVGLLVAS